MVQEQERSRCHPRGICGNWNSYRNPRLGYNSCKCSCVFAFIFLKSCLDWVHSGWILRHPIFRERVQYKIWGAPEDAEGFPWEHKGRQGNAPSLSTSPQLHGKLDLLSFISIWDAANSKHPKVIDTSAVCPIQLGAEDFAAAREEWKDIVFSDEEDGNWVYWTHTTTFY